LDIIAHFTTSKRDADDTGGAEAVQYGCGKGRVYVRVRCVLFMLPPECLRGAVAVCGGGR